MRGALQPLAPSPCRRSRAGRRRSPARCARETSTLPGTPCRSRDACPTIGRAGDRDAALVVAEQAADDVEQRRLAAARRADDRHELAGRDGERDVVDGDDRRRRCVANRLVMCSTSSRRASRAITVRDAGADRLASARRNLDQLGELLLGQRRGGELERDGIRHDRVEPDDLVRIDRRLRERNRRACAWPSRAGCRRNPRRS